MIALLTTISHCPLVTMGFSTGVSGDANAGTCSMRLTRFCHDSLGCAFGFDGNEASVFSDVGDVGKAIDGGLRVEVGDIGPAIDPRSSARRSETFVLTLSGPVTVDVESPAPPRKYIATLRGPHFDCRYPRSLSTGPTSTSGLVGVAEADGRREALTSEAKWTPRDGFSRSMAGACGTTAGAANVGVAAEGSELTADSARLCRDERFGRPSKSKASIRWCSAAHRACDSMSSEHIEL